MKKLATPIVPMVCSVLLSACASHPLPPSPTHIAEAPRAAGAIPEPVQQSLALPPPSATAKVETYSVTVHKVPVESLLFALARDAGLNVDIHPGIEGVVTLNALDQTLPQLLSRIQRQVDMRYEIHGDTLTVLPDTPEWRNYKVDYVNIARSTSSSVNIATQISTTGGGAGAANPVAATSSASGSSSGSTVTAASNNNNGANGNGSNNSTTVVNNRSDNNFWYSLEKNIRDMLRTSNLNDSGTDPLGAFNQAATPAGVPGAAPAAGGFDAAAFGGNKASSKNSTSVIVNAEGGLIAVRATARQHERIREFLDIVLGAAKRQVLIEATIIEVRLGDQYQQGINWSSLSNSGLKLTQAQVGTAALPSNVNPGTSPGVFVLNYANPTSRLGNMPPPSSCWNRSAKSKYCPAPRSAC